MYPSYSTPTGTNFSTTTTSMAVSMPASVSSGNLLLAIVSTRYAPTWTLPTGWTLLFSKAGGSSVGQMSVFYKKATGSEGGTSPTWTAGTGTTATWQVLNISGWDGSTTPDYSTANGDFTTNPSSPALTPAGGSKGYLWLAIVSDAATGSAFTSAPSGYSGFKNTGLAAGGADAELATSYLDATASNETPGVWGYGSNRYWAAATLAITPSSGGSNYNQTETDNAASSDSHTQSAGKILSDNGSSSDSHTQSIGKIQSDSEGSSDSSTKSTQKQESDNQGFSDISLRSPSKGMADSQKQSDNVIKSPNKQSSDNQGFSDMIAPKQIGKVATDTQVESDSTSKNIARSPLTDSQLESDTAIKSISRSTNDTQSETDIGIRSVGKSGSDSQGSSDTSIKASAKIITDVAGNIDNIIRSAQKLLQDTVGFSELITVVKQSGQHYAITLTDTLGQIDSILKGPNKVPTDIQLSSDTIAPRQLGKVQIDTQFALDTIKKSFSRNALTDNFKASDTVTKNPNKINSDNQGSSDTLGAKQVNKVVNDTQGFGNEGVSIVVHGLVNEEAGITIDVIAPPVFVDSLVSSIYMESNIVTTILNNPPVKANSMSVKANSLTVYATDAYTGVIGSVGADNTSDVTPEVIPDGVYVPIINNYL